MEFVGVQDTLPEIAEVGRPKKESTELMIKIINESGSEKVCVFRFKTVNERASVQRLFYRYYQLDKIVDRPGYQMRTRCWDEGGFYMGVYWQNGDRALERTVYPYTVSLKQIAKLKTPRIRQYKKAGRPKGQVEQPTSFRVSVVDREPAVAPVEQPFSEDEVVYVSEIMTGDGPMSLDKFLA